MEITFHETNADQNHNMEKVINGSIEVEFGMVGSEYILSHYDTILTRNDFSTTVTNTTTGTIYKSLDESQYDDFGEVYYFAGNPTDNWVHFGGFYWRIIRINGNGSIRMIYSGSDATGPVTTGTDTQIGTSAFNGSNNNNAYVGYMYQSGQLHGLQRSSAIKEMLDNWYSTYIENRNIHYERYIDGNAGFCGDRSTYDGSGTGTATTVYGAYNRLFMNKAPILICKNASDLYTTSGSEAGNQALTYPVGLITADEVAIAGGLWTVANQSYYLYTGQNDWLMTPHYFGGNYAYVFGTSSVGSINSWYVYNQIGIRPVINLKSDISLTGTGSIDDPYEPV